MSGNILLRDSLTLCVESFYTAKESENCTSKTLTAYRTSIDRFVSWLRANGVSDVAKITPAHVRLYFADLNKQGYSAWTVHDYARPIKTFLRFLYNDEILPSDIMAKVKMPRLEKPILPSLDKSDVDRMIAACDSKRDETIILFMISTGVRANELCQITVGDFDLLTGSTQIRNGKGRKGRTVFADSRARKAVLRYLLTRGNPANDAPLFPSTRDDNQHLTPNGLLEMFRRLEKKSGVRVHPHTLRRVFALESLRAGMDVIRLCALMGHSDMSVIRGYTAIVDNDLENAVKDHSALNHLMNGNGGNGVSRRNEKGGKR